MHAMRRLARLFQVLLAIVFLIEAWLWRYLGPVVSWVIERIPLRAIKAWIAKSIEKLPPPAALVVFTIPAALLFPLKVLAVWFLAHGKFLAAIGVLVFAKLTGVGVTAFVFEATRPKLLQMAWFRWLYERVLIALAWAHRLVDPIKARVRRYLEIFRPRRVMRTLRLFRRIRRRMRAAHRAADAAIRTDAPRAAPSARSP
jgi:hypothetical protein